MHACFMKFLKNIKDLRASFSVLVLLTLMNTACGQESFDKKLNSLYRNTVPLIQPAEFEKKVNQGELVILDIRSENEYNVSHIPNARFIDYDNFSEKDVENLDKDSEIVLYCSVGYRSERVGEKMKELGFKNVQNLYGGIFQWKNTNHEVVNPLGSPTDSVHTYNKNWSKWLTNGIKIYE